MNVNTAAPLDPSGQVDRDADVEYEVQVEAERRLEARAEQSVHRFIGVAEAGARALTDELDFAIRFFQRGESLTEDDCPGRVTAQIADGVVAAARAIHQTSGE